ncbi:uncharacterized protein LOC135492900 [Lineus longissimus]|uniref:uncharacterized protein LOC135492900 n=1 Tax=Lineus longissimus TaxID=88925 RepID=UPI002B4D946D
MKKYFVAKCATLESLKMALETGMWACGDRKMPPQPSVYLDAAFKDCDEVILLFSVNNQHGWHGYAAMTSSPGARADESTMTSSSGARADESKQDEPNETNWHRFRIDWKTIFMAEFGEQCLPFEKTAHLVVETLSEGTLPLNKTRNYEEVPSVVGGEFCALLDEHYKLLVLKKEQKLEAKLKVQPDAFFIPESDLSIDAVWRKLISKVETHGTILLACPFGSQRYNLSTPDSDVDMFIVYTADTRDVLGFNPPQTTIKNRESETFDYTILEVHRYCELLLGGDPKCVETLFMEPMTIRHADPIWRQLCENRRLFLTRSCLEKYLRDAQGSKGTKYINRLLQQHKDGATVKKLQKVFYVVVRLLQNALDIATGQDLQVFRQESSEEWKLLRGIRTGGLESDQIQEIITSLTKSIETSTETMPRADTEQAKTLLQDWLLKLRYENLKHFMESKYS